TGAFDGGPDAEAVGHARKYDCPVLGKSRQHWEVRGQLCLDWKQSPVVPSYQPTAVAELGSAGMSGLLGVEPGPYVQQSPLSRAGAVSLVGWQSVVPLNRGLQ